MITLIPLTISLALACQAPIAGTAASQAAGQPVQVTTETGVLGGTLIAPHAPGKVTVVLIIAGSGPTDRDGNSPLLPGKNNTYKMLAEALAAQGIASVRYDKRGIGESQAAGGTSESELRFDRYVDDAAAWIKQLRADAWFSQVAVVGHSEGSLIGMLAASRAKADGFVSIAGFARRASEVLRDQLLPQIGTMETLRSQSDQVLTSLEAGKTVDPLPKDLAGIPGLASLYRPSVQPYLISWFQYTPSVELARLTMPVLLIQGTTDIQVSADEARALKKAKADAELVLVEGMNHVLKQAPADHVQNAAKYSNPDLPIVPDVPKAIVAFVQRLTAR